MTNRVRGRPNGPHLRPADPNDPYDHALALPSADVPAYPPQSYILPDPYIAPLHAPPNHPAHAPTDAYYPAASDDDFSSHLNPAASHLHPLYHPAAASLSAASLSAAPFDSSFDNSFGLKRPTASLVNFDQDPTQPSWLERQRPPSRGERRRVQLTHGNWIVDYPVPSAVRNAMDPLVVAQGQPHEFSHLRYSAVTCDPDEFTRANGWGLRASTAFGRQTELLICLTYYNEDRVLLARSLHGVMQNIRDICRSRSSAYWRASEENGQPAWQRIVVSLVFDGIDPCDKETLDLLATVGVYQDGIMKRKVDDRDTVAHLFEYSTQLSVDASLNLVQPRGAHDSDLVPVQLIFCLKQHNAKKINSHRWLFNALARHLQPEVCVLLDVGTKPGPMSIYHLWNAFHNNPHLGGACGEIHAMIRRGTKLINPLVAAQNFEYKISNILDKPLESVFGYVSVLPGAFSAYRYSAICGRPLEQYFHGDHSLAQRLGAKGINGMGIFAKNMFLAEDRILCFELVAKAGDRWTLAYVKPSKAETDVPEHAAELISQRRRWLNGSFAASIYSLVHFYRFYSSGHNPLRLIAFHIQALYNIIQLVYSWFALANLWLAFVIIIQYLPDVLLHNFSRAWVVAFHWVNLVLMWVYGFFVALQFVLALGSRPKGERGLYALSFVVFALLGTYLLGISLWLTVNALTHARPADGDYAHAVFSSTTAVLVASLAAMFGLYTIASILYADPWHMVSSSLQYALVAPSFTNIINVYAFCNLHDVSWGTKGSDKVDALPAVDTTRNSESAPAEAEEYAFTQQEIDARFKDVVARALAPHRPDTHTEPPSIDDSNKKFRTRLLAFWLLCNALLTAVILNLNGYSPNDKLDDEAHQRKLNQQIYFKVILWSTFGLTLVRFIGCVLYWLQRNTTRWFRST
ncbi:chitin synthase [Malassezia cuniculi]|uniref:Chitin synthase n=1 Tax=Malassezia cuniculi TaxID=948313 RepID=A0AAF0J792_9BASI|nr:chitin synthase [Malassezia cuniculi]